MKRFGYAVSVLLSSTAVFAQTGISPITPQGVAEALEFGKTQSALELASPIHLRLKGLDPIRDRVEFSRLVNQLEDAPFAFYIQSPYVSAAMLSAEATRKYEPLPQVTAEQLNARQVVVHVTTGSSFISAQSIENVVIKRDGNVIQPIKKEITPSEVHNRMGASKKIADGDFTFDFATFAPTSPITIVLIGDEGNFEWTMTPEELGRLK